MADRRIAAGAAILILGCALGATLVAPPAPRLLWNASASTPIGLYAVLPGATIGPGDRAVVRTPAAVRDLAARRHYLPANVPLVKRVAAISGQRICASGSRLLIDGVPAAVRFARDTRGRPLPRWQGCRTLARGELLVLGDAPGSFDGRYFGPVTRTAVIGRAIPLWTW